MRERRVDTQRLGLDVTGAGATESRLSVNVLISVDAGLAEAALDVVQIEKNRLIPLEMHFLGTEKSDKKRNVFACDDDFRRAREIAKMVDDIFTDQERKGRRIRAICAESMSFVRNQRASTQIALFWGVLASAAHRLQLPVVQTSPQEIRRYFNVPKGVAKDDGKRAVHEVLFKRFNASLDLGLLLAKVGEGRTEKQREKLCKHPLDALAAACAAEESDVVRMIRASL